MYQSNNEFIITQTFEAPRDVLWKAWTQAEHLKHWWGPKGSKINIPRLELRPGGMFHYCTRSPDGQTMWGKFVYRHITGPEKLVFISSFSDEAGGITRHPLSLTWPLEILNTLLFTEVNGETTLILRGGPIHASEAEHKTYYDFEASLRQEFTGTFDQLDEYLEVME